MRKQKLPKYIQQKFTKPQFKIGDRVKYEFLGEHGWGIITKINKHNDKITYMVKGKGYTYPCGLQIKEYRSYYAGSIDYAETNKRNNESTGVPTIKKRTNNKNTVMRTRPIFEDWGLSFSIIYNNRMFKSEDVVDMVKSGGEMIGLLEFRPTYGTFKVTSHKQVAV